MFSNLINKLWPSPKSRQSADQDFIDRFRLFEDDKAKGEEYFPVDAETMAEYQLKRPEGAKPVLCYAPFKNMYFGHFGKVVACCYQRTNILGVYPKNSIRDIWFGEKQDKLRRCMAKNDMTLGCKSCEIQLDGKNFEGLKAKGFDTQPANDNLFPSSMEFELSNTCNLECIMCTGEFSSSIRKNRENLPPLHSPYDAEFIKQLEEFIPHLHETRFYGGEPFLVDVYYDIWDKILELNPACKISIQTNATILNNRVKELLRKGNFQINISLDALDKENYESIRVNAKYDRVMENLHYFVKYCKDKGSFIGISACYMQQNWREMPDFINFCNKLDVPVYFHMVSNPRECGVSSMSAPELKELLDFYAQDFGFTGNSDIQKKNIQHFNDLVLQVEYWYNGKLNAPATVSALGITNKAELYEKIAQKVAVEYVKLSQEGQQAVYADIISKLDGVYDAYPYMESAIPGMAELMLDNLGVIKIKSIDDFIQTSYDHYHKHNTGTT